MTMTVGDMIALFALVLAVVSAIVTGTWWLGRTLKEMNITLKATQACAHKTAEAVDELKLAFDRHLTEKPIEFFNQGTGD